ncbi:hypothetical protein CHT98_17885 (plasmid) [Azospirillum brasilense]|uniref:Uncharacterized protein n=1 Tax=Azospirillum brasilense TaxID=192 RepID=A0A235HAY5_AZOBR|nr:hypothetical protein CHT98_17885 [Azospirillum brasilense]
MPFAVKRAACSLSDVQGRGATRARCDRMPRAVSLPSYGRLGSFNKKAAGEPGPGMVGRNDRLQGRTNRSHGKQGWDSRCRRAPSYRWAFGYSPWC